MNKPLRIGLVGAGMVSRHHLIAWASIAAVSYTHLTLPTIYSV